MKIKNRLRLNFSLPTDKERLEFVLDYLPQLDNPTEDELEMIANYLLWGKKENGKNVTQEKLVQIPTRSGLWDNIKDEDSLEALLEEPTFSEVIFNAPKVKVKKTKFSRKEAREKSSPEILAQFELLWEQIDRLELGINYYDLEKGKRKNPPRDALLELFTEEEKTTIRDKALKWTLQQYLKSRHLLVELRRDQYTLADTYLEKIVAGEYTLAEPELPFEFNTDIRVAPLGLYDKKSLVFLEKDKLIPDTFNEKELRELSEDYWQRKKDDGRETIDFTNPDDVATLINNFVEHQGDIEVLKEEGDTSLSKLFETLEYYINYAEINEAYKEVLKLKFNKVPNHQIVKCVANKFGITYTINYISTIFRQKIIPKVCAAAVDHEQTVGSVFFPEDFKKCSCCGKVLPRNANYFMRRSRTSDGFAARCKKCDSLARKRKKEANK